MNIYDAALAHKHTWRPIVCGTFSYLFVTQVNRSSLLVPEQVAKPQEVNGTNGKAELPVTDAVKQAEHSTDSEEEEEEEAGDTDDPGNSKSL